MTGSSTSSCGVTSKEEKQTVQYRRRMQVFFRLAESWKVRSGPSAEQGFTNTLANLNILDGTPVQCVGDRKPPKAGL